MLVDSDSESDDLNTLTINEHYAKAFEYKKEREELAKLKEKYGSDYSESGVSDAEDLEDSEDTEEDSDGEELTPAVDAAILRTLALIRKKDPAIYEDDRQVFEEEHTRTQDKAPMTKPKAKDKLKPLTIREAALASALAAASHSRSPSPEPHPPTHAEEQALLRSETRAAFHDAVDSEAQEDDDDLLVPRSRTRDEFELEEEEYRSFLEREVGEDLHNLVSVETDEAVVATDDVGDGNKQHGRKKKKGKKEREKEKEKDEVPRKKSPRRVDKKSKEEAEHDFLTKASAMSSSRDNIDALYSYIFNRGWIDHSNRRVPTYDEIVESSSKQSNRKPTKSRVHTNGTEDADQNLDEQATQDATFSEDSFDDLADAFETSYNFRFEEPYDFEIATDDNSRGGALIASFPRNMQSVRRESTTRKDARARKKGRQVAEKQTLLEARREEFRRERALAEAAVGTEEPGDEVLVIGEDTSNKKKSKKQLRREELARLKALKTKELRRKLEMVSSEGGLGGISDEALSHLDLDADWDPLKHDTQMAELYGGAEDIADDGDVEKPVWDDDINIDDIVPPTQAKSKAELKKQRKKERKKNQNVDDTGVDLDEMDADLDNWDNDTEDWRGTEEERKRKVDMYMDEVVNRLGFSGITSHMPTRFHYTSTVPENYGLEPAEILLATDAELNSYVGLKKLAPYRVEKRKKNWDPKRTQRLKEFRGNLHSRMGSRYGGAWSLGAGTNSESRGADAHGEKKKRKGKKERAKLKAAQAEDDGEGDDMVNTDVQPNPPQKRKNNLNASSHSYAPLPDDEGDGEDGAQRKKRRRRHKKRSGEGGEADAAAVS